VDTKLVQERCDVVALTVEDRAYRPDEPAGSPVATQVWADDPIAILEGNHLWPEHLVRRSQSGDEHKGVADSLVSMKYGQFIIMCKSSHHLEYTN
jgi:hypothetical protein